MQKNWVEHNITEPYWYMYIQEQKPEMVSHIKSRGSVCLVFFLFCFVVVVFFFLLLGIARDLSISELWKYCLTCK